jgi:hypothetical protein
LGTCDQMELDYRKEMKSSILEGVRNEDVIEDELVCNLKMCAKEHNTLKTFLKKLLKQMVL